MRSIHEVIADIELLVEELKQIAGLEPGKTTATSAKVRRSRERIAPRAQGLIGEIIKLRDEGFFDQRRTISEIQAKLRDKGSRKPATTLMSPLLRLIRRNELDRSKSDKGQYQYFKPTK